MALNTFEIRNYLFKPGTAQHFIDYFEAVFIDSQEAVGMYPVGQFRLIGEPDRFVWIRGFGDIETRLASLTAFYYGDVWKKLGPGANFSMLDSSDVRLVRPCAEISALTGGMTSQRLAADIADGTVSQETGVIALDIYRAKNAPLDALIDAYEGRVAPEYAAQGVQLRGTFVAEMAENLWKRHPARQNADEFIAVTAYPDEISCREIRASAAPLIDAPYKSLLLSPTLRSPVRYTPPVRRKKK